MVDGEAQKEAQKIERVDWDGKHDGGDVCIMVVTRVDQAVVRLLYHIADYCFRKTRELNRKVTIVVDELIKDNPEFNYEKLLKTQPEAGEGIKFWSSSSVIWLSRIKKIDCVLSLGGDGTILYAIRLFRDFKIPPVMSYNLGSLGFLTNFKNESIRQDIDVILEGRMDTFFIETRSRLECVLYRDVSTIDNSIDLYGLSKISTKSKSDVDDKMWVYGEGDEIMIHQEKGKYSTFVMGDEHRFVQLDKDHSEGQVPVGTKVYCKTPLFSILNDVIIDRGASSTSIQLFLYIDDVQVTIIQADGIIVSTPTGSTAYSLSSGGSLVHPESSVILITPICTHTLSFRPIIIPDTKRVMVKVPDVVRSTVEACFDGKSRSKLYPGDCITISKYENSVRFLCPKQNKDHWFIALKSILNWNTRIVQRSSTPLDLYDPLIRSLRSNGETLAASSNETD